MTSTAEAVLFWSLAPLMVLAAMGLLFARKAVHATISVVFVMISLAVLYVANEAPFLGIAQVVVYTGAIMMLFLFVIMLVGVGASDSLVETVRGQRFIGVLFAGGLAIILLAFLGRLTVGPGVGHEATVADNPTAIARVLLGNFVFPLELVGVLLVTAALAALSLTHQRRLRDRVSQKTLPMRGLRRAAVSLRCQARVCLLDVTLWMCLLLIRTGGRWSHRSHGCCGRVVRNVTLLLTQRLLR